MRWAEDRNIYKIEKEREGGRARRREGRVSNLTYFFADEGVISWGKMELLGQAISKQPRYAVLLLFYVLYFSFLLFIPRYIIRII